jgi:LmbE family N-acetylglucosaminyl deacetylase
MKVLAIFAHPDDESYGPGGTLARYAQEGHEISLLTFTRGESGTLGISKKLSSKKLAALRTCELQCAAKKLGIHHLQIFSFPDKKLSKVNDKRGEQLILKEIQNFEPDLVITFHENTISGHPDHYAVTKWTYETIRRLKNPPKLCYYGLILDQTAKVQQRKLFAIKSQEITHKIDVSATLKQKVKAIQCHKTQQELWKLFQKMEDKFENFASWEYFSQVLQKIEIASDLFQ